MLRILMAAGACLALIACGPQAWAQAASPRAEAFAAPPPYHNISLSPSGQQVAMIVQRDSIFHLEVWPVGASAPSATYAFGAARAPNWLVWKGDDRLLVSVSVPTGIGEFQLNQTRLVSFSSRLTQPVVLSDLNNRMRFTPVYQDRLVHLLPDDNRNILVQMNSVQPFRPTVYRVDVRTGRLTEYRRENDLVRHWIADAEGQIILGLGDPVRTDTELFRARPRHWEVDAITLSGAGDIFNVQGFDGDPDRLVVLSNHEGPTTGLYIYDLAAGGFTQTLFKDETYDALSAIMSPDGHRVVGAGYYSDIYHTVYFDAAARERANGVGALIQMPETLISDQTADGRYVIAADYNVARRQQAYWVDTVASVVRPVGQPQNPLADYTPAKVIPINYAARDGLTIPAYVTLPPGLTRETARGIPFVVMPHGGPHARDNAEFDFLAQFIASLGYGVLQPNFRGSTGYGEAFRQAGEQEWGGAILDDVEDGTRWLIAEGLADPSRMCIVGWSFGGYLSMMAAVEHGDLFRCASAVAPVTDLPHLIEEESKLYGGGTIIRRMIGRMSTDAARLEAESPARRAREVSMPVLIAHGTVDDVVPIIQSEKMVDALKAAGKDVEFLTLDWGDHSLSRTSGRLVYLQRLEVFLNTHIGPGVAEPASQPVPVS
ncbi:S9 family peptidase [Brevundimonas vitis]|uniref:S9 family peptidase n=1 Tax=Brevundimonas vitisensis TaxID=2800818 RepID=A0ABX7BJU7_9CAUL|nr:S9 family peptidase [Brevundimonas vitisensis]QQQ17496.1 S9 family peptidase [Brevundimonas vitisensis]